VVGLAGSDHARSHGGAQPQQSVPAQGQAPAGARATTHTPTHPPRGRAGGRAGGRAVSLARPARAPSEGRISFRSPAPASRAGSRRIACQTAGPSAISLASCPAQPGSRVASRRRLAPQAAGCRRPGTMLAAQAQPPPPGAGQGGVAALSNNGVRSRQITWWGAAAECGVVAVHAAEPLRPFLPLTRPPCCWHHNCHPAGGSGWPSNTLLCLGVSSASAVSYGDQVVSCFGLLARWLGALGKAGKAAPARALGRLGGGAGACCQLPLQSLLAVQSIVGLGRDCDGIYVRLPHLTFHAGVMAAPEGRSQRPERPRGAIQEAQLCATH